MTEKVPESHPTLTAEVEHKSENGLPKPHPTASVEVEHKE